ncbi:sulfotransferase [Elusimicrobiota bacterium]
MRETWVMNDPFFIIYDARSGSTYFSNLLIKNARVAVPPEANFITSILSEFKRENVEDTDDLNGLLDIIYNDDKFEDWDMDIDEVKIKTIARLPVSLNEFIKSVLAVYNARHFSKAQITGIKKGSYVFYYKQIAGLFPDTRFIGIVRDGRAVFNSKKRSIQSATGRPFETNPYKAAKQWCSILDVFEEINKNNIPLMILRYEDIVSNPEKVLKKACEYIQTDFIRDIQEDKSYYVSERYGRLHENIDKPPELDKISSWKNHLTDEEVFAYESVAHHKLLMNGYKLVNDKNDLASKKNRMSNKVKLIENIFRKPERKSIKNEGKR